MKFQMPYLDFNEEIQKSILNYSAITNGNTPGIFGHHLCPIASHFVEHSVAPSTMNTYSRGLTQFEQFLTEFCLKPIWPFSVDHILRFIAHLYQPKITHSTISC